MNGIILLDKPSGYTSFGAVRAVSRLFSREKAGHSGTLDPAATGVLPVFLGRATKLIPLLPDTDKSYTATAVFGSSTDTGDAEGEVTAFTESVPTEEQLLSVLPSFLGPQLQVPPMYSAKKRNGVPLYRLARQGETVEREACSIVIRSLELAGFSGNNFTLDVTCSGGTYVRTLAEDIAAACGSLCHLTSLRRTGACGFRLEDCVTLEELQELAAEGRQDEALLGCDSAFRDLDSIKLDEDLSRLLLNGFRFPASRAGLLPEPGKRYKVYDERGSFTALCSINDRLELIKLWQADTVQTGRTLL